MSTIDYNTFAARRFATSGAANDDVTDVEDLFGSTFSTEEMYAALGLLGVKHPVIGTITALASVVLGAVGGIYVGMYLGTVVLTMTGSMFLGCCVTFLASFITSLVTMRAGMRVAQYVALGEFEDDYQAAKDWVGDKITSAFSWFSSKKGS